MTRSHRFQVILLLFLPICTFAQKEDSLRSVLDTARNHYRVKALNELFKESFNHDPVKAVGYAREALRNASESGDRKGLAAAYNNLGVAYRTQGAMDKALGYYLQALKIYEEIDHKEGVSSTKSNMANIYALRKDYEQSMKYMTESHKIFVEMSDTDKMIGSLNNLGNLHSELQMDERALEYYREAYNLSEKRKMSTGDPLTNIGNVYFRRNEYAEAATYYDKALQIERNGRNTIGLLNALTNLGVTYTKMKKAKEAETFLDDALNVCNQNMAWSFLPAIYKAQAENYATQNRFKEAFEKQLRYDESRELVYGEESTRRIAQMELRLKFEDLEREFETLKQQDAINSLELKNTRLVILVFFLAGMFGLGLLNFIMVTRRKSVRQKTI